MGVKVHIPRYMRHTTQDMGMVQADGNTIGECLTHVVREFPGLQKQLFARDGSLAIYIDVWLNGESAYPEELLKPVQDGDELYLVTLG